MICVDIPRTPSLKVAQSRLDLYNDAEDESDGDDDVIPAVFEKKKKQRAL